MRLSIITINYNNVEGLKKTIQSVVSQTFRDFEWIVIDGGSTDGSKDLIEQYASHFSYWVSEPDNGIYNAMNKGIKVATGDYCLFLNSGDSLCDDSIIDAFCQLRPTADIVAGNLIVNDSIYDVRISPDEEELNYQFMCDNTILHPSSFIKRELFFKYGLYDESLKIVADWKFFFICLIQHSCSYQKWERCIASFNTYGISEKTESAVLIESERERVKAEVLPYVHRTYLALKGRIAEQEKTLHLTVREKFFRFIQKILRKLSSILCLSYLSLKRTLNKPRNTRASEEKIIVSFTSWKKRINNVPLVVESILANTVKPDRIVLNLSEEEFVKKEQELPETILNLVSTGTIDIIWTRGNLKAFKKFIPTMTKYPNDIIIAIDDDFIYPADLIETFVEKHKQIPNSPLSGNTMRINGVNAHCGCASLIKKEYFGKYIDELLDDKVVALNMDDVYYVFCAALNGIYYQFVGKLFFTNMKQLNPVEGLSTNYVDANAIMAEYLIDKIRHLYHIDMTKVHKPYFTLK